MNAFGRILLLILTFVSVVLADTVSCRDSRAETTYCDPYSTKFIKPKKLKKDIKSLRHKPITKREIPIVERIMVKNGITLHNLIIKYIKREEREYRQFESKKIDNDMSLRYGPREVSLITESIMKRPLKVIEKKTIKASKEKSIENIASKPSKTVVTKPGKLLAKELTANYDDNASKKIQPEAKAPISIKAKSSTIEKGTKEIKQYLDNLAVYIVQKGDTLTSIANKFGMSVDRLVKINGLKSRQNLKANQKLRIPISQERLDAINIAFYVVRRGDSLSGIANRFGVKLSDLKKYNKIKKNSIIHTGQGLVLPLPHKLAELKRIEEKKEKEHLKKKRERERLARIALKKKERAKFLRISKGLKRKLSVTATAYTSHQSQTDSTPFLAAWNNRIRPGMKIIAVSRDLIYRYGIKNGTKVRISGLKGIYTVRDKMNKRWRRRIDIYMGMNRYRALKWGRRKVTLYY